MGASRRVFTVAGVAIGLHSVFTVGLPWLLVALTSAAGWWVVPLGPARWLGLAGMVFGVYVYVSTASRLVSCRTSALPWHRAEALQVDGWYSVVRHPLLLGVVCILFGESIVFQSPALLAYAVIYWIGVDRWVVRPEEAQLRGVFGDRYAEYSRNVPRWVPRPSPKRSTAG